VKAWDELSDNERRLAARLQEAFAAFLDHTDVQIGRLVEGLRELRPARQHDLRRACRQRRLAGGREHRRHARDEVLQRHHRDARRRGGATRRPSAVPNSHTNYPWGWAQCGNTPFRWYKQNTHEGGVHVPMVVHWPAGLDPADQRAPSASQFVFVSDIVPTIYDLVGVSPPQVYVGASSRCPSPATRSPPCSATRRRRPPTPCSTSRTMGSMAPWWPAAGRRCCRTHPGADFATEPWELYHLDEDWSETNDLAATHPEKLAELEARWWEEADKHGVLPIDDRLIELFGARFREGSPHPPSKRYVYRPPMSPLPGQAAAAIAARSFDLTGRVTREAGDEGVLFALGTENSGLSVFVQGDRFVVDYNAFDDHTIIESDAELPLGEVELAGSACVAVQGMLGARRDAWSTVAWSAAADLGLYMRMISSIGPSVGGDHGSPVSQRYEAPFEFTGTLHEVVVQASPEKYADVADAAGRAEMSRQ
jgi:hypothetical protein